MPRKFFEYTINASKNAIEAQLLQFGQTEDTINNYWTQQYDDTTTLGEFFKSQVLADSERMFALHYLANKDNVEVSEETRTQAYADIDAQVDTLSENGAADGIAAFTDSTGSTPEEAKEMYDIILRADAYKESINVSDEELRAHFDEHVDEHKQVTVQHILLQLHEDATDEQAKEIESKANDILELVKNDGDMKELAANYSEDPGSKDN